MRKQEKSCKYWKCGTINVKTLRTDAKAYEVAKSADNASLLICGLQEIRRLSHGEVDIDLPNSSYKFIWNGDNMNRQGGVGILVKKYNFIKIIDVESISLRLIIVKTLIHNLNFKFVVAYAPTEDSSSASKNKFHHQLELCCCKDNPTKFKLIVLGDLKPLCRFGKT